MDTRMKSNAGKQRMLMKIFSAPVKILSKARDIYMKGMENCSNRASYGAAPGVLLTKSSIVNSFTACDNEEFWKLLGATSGKKARQTALLTRNYSVTLGKIGRIEEDKPCAFEEDVFKSESSYPRVEIMLLGGIWYNNREGFINIRILETD